MASLEVVGVEVVSLVLAVVVNLIKQELALTFFSEVMSNLIYSPPLPYNVFRVETR